MRIIQGCNDAEIPFTECSKQSHSQTEPLCAAILGYSTSKQSRQHLHPGFTETPPKIHTGNREDFLQPPPRPVSQADAFTLKTSFPAHRSCCLRLHRVISAPFQSSFCKRDASQDAPILYTVPQLQPLHRDTSIYTSQVKWTNYRGHFLWPNNHHLKHAMWCYWHSKRVWRNLENLLIAHA